MQLSITGAYRERDRKVHINGDNELAKRVPKCVWVGGEKLIATNSGLTANLNINEWLLQSSCFHMFYR